jgi:hypothetical protein
MLNVRLQNQPAVTVESSSQQSARSLANISGKIVQGGLPGLDSVIAGGNLNAFPQAALELLDAFWSQTPVVVRPTLKGVGTIQGYEYVSNVDPGPEGFARFDEGGDRVYVWNGSDWYFGTWFGRWFKDPTIDPVNSPSALSESVPLGIPSGTLFNSAAWQAGDAARPAGTILVPDNVDQEQTNAGGLTPPSPGTFDAPGAPQQGSMQQVWIAAGLIGVAGFLFLRRKR